MRRERERDKEREGKRGLMRLDGRAGEVFQADQPTFVCRGSTS